MAGFEGPPDPGSGSDGATKLPSWAVTRSAPGPDLAAPGAAPAPPADPGSFADVGPAGPGREAPRPDRPVVREPEHPFDVDDPFGDNQPGGVGSPWNRPPAAESDVRVVDLADEFELTTAQALEVCAAAGAPASSGAAWLTADQAEAFRVAVATYDRTAATDDAYPTWAVPPGGRRPPLHRAADADAIVPGAMLLARTGPVPDDDPDPSDSGRMRVVLLVVALLVIAVLVAMLLLG